MWAHFDSGFAIQGELVGEGIQGNPYKIEGREFYIFNVYDISARKYVPPVLAKTFTEAMGLKYVPIVTETGSIEPNLGSILSMADGYSFVNPSTLREGLVFKRVDMMTSFKAISNKWLLKEKD